MKKPDLSEPQPSLPGFYGTTEVDGPVYLEVFSAFHPEVEDPRYEETDVRALVVAGRGREHGRLKVLDRVTPRTPALSLTRIKATLTADDPTIPPRRRPSQANADVSFSYFHPLSDICSRVAKLTRFIIFEIVAGFGRGLQGRSYGTCGGA